ncbi:hypothetical protein, partial [Microbacterium arabinogalactanolyticum]|uniref:hypothetical protein n=1 Tax=Microbacterium arabinogalactanolyticum TaxID=69365 RepID=UPI00255428FB
GVTTGKTRKLTQTRNQTTDRVNDTTDNPAQVGKTRETRDRGVTTGKTRKLTQTRNQTTDRVNDTTDN